MGKSLEQLVEDIIERIGHGYIVEVEPVGTISISCGTPGREVPESVMKAARECCPPDVIVEAF